MDPTTPSFATDSSYDMDAYLDLDPLFQQASPVPGSVSTSSASFASTSATSSQQSTPSMRQAHPQFSAPSHPYEMHTQQTTTPNLNFNEETFFAQDGMHMMQVDGQMPAFFFPEQDIASPSGNTVQGISPRMTTATKQQQQQQQQQLQQQQQQQQQQSQSDRKIYYPGIHQEMHAAKMLQLQQIQQQQSGTRDAQIEAFIASTKASDSTQGSSRNGNMMPQNIAKLKKQEEEMDSDERLLASEEGKKLSSKERRQLRNKVSARAFRSRRKEYISSLEAEVAKKAADNVALANDNERLLRENERLENLSRMLLQAPAFHSFMDELTSMGGAKAQEQQQQPQQQQARVSKPEPTASAPAPADWALAYNNWNPSPQVFRVELPEPPHLQQLLRDQQPKSSMCDSQSIQPEEDYSICDGFFADIRNENADFSMPSYAPEESTYTPPENLSEVVRGLEDEKPRKEAEQRASYKGENLDNLFPGVGVNNLLERIEKVASGEPAEQHFEELADTDSNSSPPAQQQRTQQHTDQQRAQDNRFKEAAGVYRRIGLMVQ